MITLQLPRRNLRHKNKQVSTKKTRGKNHVLKSSNIHIYYMLSGLNILKISVYDDNFMHKIQKDFTMVDFIFLNKNLSKKACKKSSSSFFII